MVLKEPQGFVVFVEIKVVFRNKITKEIARTGLIGMLIEDDGILGACEILNKTKEENQ